jgi:hypothetical protein
MVITDHPLHTPGHAVLVPLNPATDDAGPERIGMTDQNQRQVGSKGGLCPAGRPHDSGPFWFR